MRVRRQTTQPSATSDDCVHTKTWTSLSTVLKQFPDAVFTIAGDGDAIYRIERQIKAMELEKSVKLLGKVTEAEKVKILGQSWCMVQPSSFEGWGMTVIEANAVGTPVIASNVIGLRDSVIDGETGLLFREKDVNELARAITTLFRNKRQRETYAKNAVKWSQNFGWDTEAQKLLQHIQNTTTHIPDEKFEMAYAHAEAQK